MFVPKDYDCSVNVLMHTKMKAAGTIIFANAIFYTKWTNLLKLNQNSVVTCYTVATYAVQQLDDFHESRLPAQRHSRIVFACHIRKPRLKLPAQNLAKTLYNLHHACASKLTVN